MTGVAEMRSAAASEGARRATGALQSDFVGSTLEAT